MIDMVNLFKFRLALKQNREMREEIAIAQKLHQFRSCVNRMKEKFEPYHMGEKVWFNEDEPIDHNLSLPPWICQPYIRMEPEKHIKYIAEKLQAASERGKVEYFDDDGQKISRNVMKRLQKTSRKPNANGMRQKTTTGCRLEICSALKCKNPTVSRWHFNCSIHQSSVLIGCYSYFHFHLVKGLKCDHKMCRHCCRDKCDSEKLVCVGHIYGVEKPKRKKFQHTTDAENLQPS